MAEMADEQLIMDPKFLYKLCCDVCMSPELWLQRILFSDLTSTTMGMNMALCGGFAEGVATAFLSSDFDMLLTCPNTNVVTDEASVRSNGKDVYKFGPITFSEYVRLEVIRIADPSRSYTAPFITIDETNTAILNANALKEVFLSASCDLLSEGIDTALQGPALTTCSPVKSPGLAFDVVLCLKCEQWPSDANVRLSKSCTFNWPPFGLLQHIKSSGCEVVPVGHTDGHECDFEWRLSSSLAQRDLVRSTNIVHIQCYFLLKLILAFLIKPQVQKGLCPYHMKNIIFQVVENTDPSEWRSDNLSNCFMTCLQALLQFLQMGYLPQFFMASQNVFQRKVHGPTRHRLIEIVSGLFDEGCSCVLKCAPFTKINLPTCGHTDLRCPCYIHHWDERRRAMNNAMNFTGLAKLLSNVLRLLKDCYSNNLLQTIGSIYATLWDEPNAIFAPLGESSFDNYKKLLRCHIGYMTLNVLQQTSTTDMTRNRKMYNMLKLGERYLKENGEVDMASGKLKLATFNYQLGKVAECFRIVQEVIRQYRETFILPVSHDSSTRQSRNGYHPQYESFTQQQHLINDSSEQFRHLAFMVTFSPWELRCAPSAIQQLATLDVTGKLDMVHIDPLVYAHFLKLTCSLELRLPVQASHQSLHDMMDVVRNPWENLLFFENVAERLLQLCHQMFRYRH